ncbi:hypothetical protein [Streptomyces sp. MJM8645]|uniref:hypothetical protein n=1 Tax=Streptomycetaceae TaxID=2062 RepID=UPI0013314CE9|nr:hypothetical protein [Streptomyces sp. MJM8645]
MTTPPASQPSPPSPPQLALPSRELVGLLLVVVGTLSVTAVAFMVHPLCGAAVISAFVMAAGLWLASEDA